MTLQEMKQSQKAALEKAEAHVKAAEDAGRAMTTAETENYETAMSEYRSIGTTIKAREEQNTIRAAFGREPIVDAAARRTNFAKGMKRLLSSEYADAFNAWLTSRDHNSISAAMAEGADALGGFQVPNFSAASYEGGATSGASIVPVQIEQSIIPLAPPILGVESIATVIPTSTDMKFPRKKAHGTGAVKAEGTGTGTNLFTGTDPQTEQFTLSAFMLGHPEDISWELAQDVPAFMSFLQSDVLLSLAILKENWFVNGTGVNQAQGLIGNVGAGITSAVTTGANLIDDTLNVISTLNPVYENPNTRFLMAKATGLQIRRNQTSANLYSPVWVSDAGKNYLHGVEVVFSASMPAIAAAATPILYGDFKSGYIIGYRGGAGVNVKMLDQPKALEGLLTCLGYQRVDGRVRRSEAIQSVTLHA